MTLLKNLKKLMSENRMNQNVIDYLVNKGFDQGALSISQERHIYHQKFLKQQDLVNQLNEMIKKICQ